jgi:flagellar basal body-associated protein FliL
MIRPLLALALFPSLAAYAQSGAAEQPVETAGPVAIWAFVVLFFGAIGVYVYMTLRGGKKSKDAKHAEPKPAETKRAERA